MTYVVTDACIRCKYMDCVSVCPVDCFREGATMLVKRGKEVALCDMQTGATCRGLFETSEAVEAVFSPTGKSVALVTPGGGRVYEVASGRLRWSSATLPPA